MNYEEKYKEALNKAKSKIENDKGHVLYEDDIKEIFPELRESDDERIRKELIRYLPYCDDISKDTRKRWIDWLEKQGEKEVDPRRENLEELLVADDIYQMSMNEAMVDEAKSKAINAFLNLELVNCWDLKNKVNRNYRWLIEKGLAFGASKEMYNN